MAKLSQLDPSEEQTPFRVRRGRVDSVDLFEVKENELDILENGSSSELQLNFAIFLISLAFSSICSLATSTFKYPVVQTIFLLVSVVGILGGSYLIILWRKTRTSVSDICKKIRERIPKDAPKPCPDPAHTPEDLPEEPEQPVG